MPEEPEQVLDLPATDTTNVPTGGTQPHGWVGMPPAPKLNRPINHRIGDLITEVRKKVKDEPRWRVVADVLTRAGATAHEIEKE